MKKYPPVPAWWFGVVLLVTTGMAIGFVEGFDTGLPWWAIIVALSIQAVVMVPIFLLAALTNQMLPLGMFGALIGGFIWGGNMEAVVLFKVTQLLCLRSFCSGIESDGALGICLRPRRHGNLPSRRPEVWKLHGTCPWLTLKQTQIKK